MKHYELPWPSRWPARLASAPEAARDREHIVFDSLQKRYQGPQGPVAALSDVSFSIVRGEIFGIIGRSGAGKSTLLRTINMLERPGAGRVLIDGADVGQLDEDGLVALRRRIGMIFQHFNLLSAKTVAENDAAAARGRRQARRRARPGRRRCWTWWACATRPMPIRPSCPAARSSGSASPARWCTSRGSCCATKPRRRWIPRPPNPSWRCCATSTASSA